MRVLEFSVRKLDITDLEDVLLLGSTEPLCLVPAYSALEYIIFE